jgi:hypothetical protein
MCTVLLPLGGYPIAVNKYIIIPSYHLMNSTVQREHSTTEANKPAVVSSVGSSLPIVDPFCVTTCICYTFGSYDLSHNYSHVCVCEYEVVFVDRSLCVCLSPRKLKILSWVSVSCITDTF